MTTGDTSWQAPGGRALELSEYGVRVNTLAPEHTATPGMRGLSTGTTLNVDGEPWATSGWGRRPTNLGTVRPPSGSQCRVIRDMTDSRK